MKNILCLLFRKKQHSIAFSTGLMSARLQTSTTEAVSKGYICIFIIFSQRPSACMGADTTEITMPGFHALYFIMPLGYT